MNSPNAVRGFGPLDNVLARLRHGIAYRKLRCHQPLETCLDIGSGAYPVFLIGLQAQQKFGLDQCLTPDAAKVSTQHGIELVEYDIAQSEPLPFENDFFSAVTILAVIEHIESLKVHQILREIYRVLKPGGVIMLTTPAAWTDKLLRTLAFLKLISREEIEDHKDVFTQRKIQSCLSETGFNKIQTGTFECFMNLWAIAQK